MDAAPLALDAAARLQNAAQTAGPLLDGGAAPSAAIKLFLLFTLLSFAPALAIATTAFTRIVIVLSFLRQALGTPQLPPNQVLIALALCTSMFVMAPTMDAVYSNGLGPFMDDKIGYKEALEESAKPMLDFMLRQTKIDDLRMFYDLAGKPPPAAGEAVPMTIAVPAFMVSELSTSFQMGLYIYMPLLLIDLFVSTILMSLGMMMVPPNLIAMPLKIGVFILADGWRLVISSISKSFL